MFLRLNKRRWIFLVLGLTILFVLILTFKEEGKEEIDSREAPEVLGEVEEEANVRQGVEEGDTTGLDSRDFEDTEIALQDKQEKDSIPPTPTSKVETPAAGPIPNPNYQFFVPSDLSKLTPYDKGNLDIQKGKISFSFVPDWIGENEEETLLVANFNGTDQKNALIIAGTGNEITCDFYNDIGGHVANDSNGNLGEDYFGKSYNLEIQWDFLSEPMLINIYLNGQLNNTINPESRPIVVISQILVNPKVNNLSIIKE